MLAVCLSVSCESGAHAFLLSAMSAVSPPRGDRAAVEKKQRKACAAPVEPLSHSATACCPGFPLSIRSRVRLLHAGGGPAAAAGCAPPATPARTRPATTPRRTPARAPGFGAGGPATPATPGSRAPRRPACRRAAGGGRRARRGPAPAASPRRFETRSRGTPGRARGAGTRAGTTPATGFGCRRRPSRRCRRHGSGMETSASGDPCPIGLGP